MRTFDMTVTDLDTGETTVRPAYLIDDAADLEALFAAYEAGNLPTAK